MKPATLSKKIIEISRNNCPYRTPTVAASVVIINDHKPCEGI